MHGDTAVQGNFGLKHQLISLLIREQATVEHRSYPAKCPTKFSSTPGGLPTIIQTPCGSRCDACKIAPDAGRRPAGTTVRMNMHVPREAVQIEMIRLLSFFTGARNGPKTTVGLAGVRAYASCPAGAACEVVKQQQRGTARKVHYTGYFASIP